MDWVPHTVKALAELYHEAGGMGFFLVGVFVLLTIALVGGMVIFWRHLATIISLFREYIEQTKRQSATLIAIQADSSAIKQSNELIAARVADLPSDPLSTLDKVKEVIRETLKGFDGEVSEAKIELLARQRMKTLDPGKVKFGV